MGGVSEGKNVFLKKKKVGQIEDDDRKCHISTRYKNRQNSSSRSGEVVSQWSDPVTQLDQ
ncbi:hypothetical protein OUZ56_020103 [Daphnia magna]|uniref:Uncharacterized protein n=1 Tax=Daphnia magna TaxID=35525 RepID=A0ABQ9ZDK6_9CRUS|nr:hypothetical protein OUZ56_020103 [Daphnia magna]